MHRARAVPAAAEVVVKELSTLTMDRAGKLPAEELTATISNAFEQEQRERPLRTPLGRSDDRQADRRTVDRTLNTSRYADTQW